MSEQEPKAEDKTLQETEIKPNEIFSFNLWVFITIAYFVYLALSIIPGSFFKETLHLTYLPDPYWLISIPTHILTTLIYIFFAVKCLELTRTIDSPPYKGTHSLAILFIFFIQVDVFYKELSEKEMNKEINIDYAEGILPDCGDLNESIVKEVLG